MICSNDGGNNGLRRWQNIGPMVDELVRFDRNGRYGGGNRATSLVMVKVWL